MSCFIKIVFNAQNQFLSSGLNKFLLQNGHNKNVEPGSPIGHITLIHLSQWGHFIMSLLASTLLFCIKKIIYTVYNYLW